MKRMIKMLAFIAVGIVIVVAFPVIVTKLRAMIPGSQQ